MTFLPTTTLGLKSTATTEETVDHVLRDVDGLDKLNREYLANIETHLHEIGFHDLSGRIANLRVKMEKASNQLAEDCIDAYAL